MFLIQKNSRNTKNKTELKKNLQLITEKIGLNLRAEPSISCYYHYCTINITISMITFRSLSTNGENNNKNCPQMMKKIIVHKQQDNRVSLFAINLRLKILHKTLITFSPAHFKQAQIEVVYIEKHGPVALCVISAKVTYKISLIKYEIQ